MKKQPPKLKILKSGVKVTEIPRLGLQQVAVGTDADSPQLPSDLGCGGPISCFT